MNTRVLAGLLAVAALASAGVGISRSSLFQNPQGPDGPLASSAPAPAMRTTTLMLTVQIDAHGVQIQKATRKPDLDFTLPKGQEQMPFRWTMLDAAGRAIANGGFDPGRICLDPAFFGQPARVEGDVAQREQVVARVEQEQRRAPARRLAEVVEVVRLGVAVEADAVARGGGVTDPEALRARGARREERREGGGGGATCGRHLRRGG